MTHAPNMDYPMLVGAGIQGARITFQGAQLRAPVTFQGFGQLFPDGIDIAIPTFGYKNHISVDRRHGVIRKSLVTDAAAHDGARLREGLIDPSNTASDVWADSAYRSAENERFLKGVSKTSRIHRRKSKGRPMPARTRKANAAKSAVRSRVEHVFAYQKGPMGMVVRTIGIARAKATLTLANMAYNMTRWRWLDSRTASA
ncbi:hypothetical protein LCGC14_1431200 [marine sediment metagenome]|uniref:Transposase IS4-like domain-containing protein n=1 Tax=marine sediment metagenome TaxID=412755 RepID=A0A0F9MQ97_9ZZZZ